MNQEEILKFLNSVKLAKRILIVQDLDGVCIPLVKDPLTRRIDKSYIYAAAKLKKEFAVLTNGEHEGRRGVNRLVEKELIDLNLVKNEGLYLPGLAAGGIQYQDRFGKVEHPGVTEEEIKYLSNLPNLMKRIMSRDLHELIPSLSKEVVEKEVQKSIIDTELSPTINLNSLFSIYKDNLDMKIKLQVMIEKIMKELIKDAEKNNLENSFFLHIAPNLGRIGENEIIKYATRENIGTTDIQFMLSGSLKEAGLLVLINKFIKDATGKSPLGNDFNVRTAPRTKKLLIDLCIENIDPMDMPLLIGVGDTVTSDKEKGRKGWLRGGSDRGFLELIQEIGDKFKINNQVLLVDSSGGEVDRPSLKNKELKGVSDPEDPLNFNILFKNGPSEYISFFKDLANERSIEIG